MTRLIRGIRRACKLRTKSLHKELRPGASGHWNLSTKLTFSFLETLKLKEFTKTVFSRSNLGQAGRDDKNT